MRLSVEQTTPFGSLSSETEITIAGLSQSKVNEILPFLNKAVLGIAPAAADEPEKILPYGNSQYDDMSMLRRLITDTYVATKNGGIANKINLIKFVRRITLWGLKDSKDFVDSCQRDAGAVPDPGPNPEVLRSANRVGAGELLKALFDLESFNRIETGAVQNAMSKALGIDSSEAYDLYWDNYHPAVEVGEAA